MTRRTPPTDLDREIGERIRQLRLSAEHSHAEMGREIGISELELCRIEAGRARISKALLVKLTKQYGVTVASILSSATAAAEPAPEDEVSRLLRVVDQLDEEGRRKVREHAEILFEMQQISQT